MERSTFVSKESFRNLDQTLLKETVVSRKARIKSGMAGLETTTFQTHGKENSFLVNQLLKFISITNC